MGWKIVVYIPVEGEDPQIYNTKREAEEDLENDKLFFPENIYKIEKVKED